MTICFVCDDVVPISGAASVCIVACIVIVVCVAPVCVFVNVFCVKSKFTFMSFGGPSAWATVHFSYFTSLLIGVRA